MDELEHKVYRSYDPNSTQSNNPSPMSSTISITTKETKGKSLPELERERNNMELDLTADILLFNHRVTKQINDLEKISV